MPLPVAARRPALRGAVIALVLAGSCGLALAEPDDATDPILKLLADKGLVANKGLADGASRLTAAAMEFIGIRYQRGGASADTGFDCSGFTRHVFEMSLGLVLPRRADEQAAAPGWVAVRREDLRPGDLVFFNTLKRTFSHVGIYVGDNRFVHSPRTGSSIRTEDMTFAYWAKRFTGARRVDAKLAADPALDLRAAPAAATGS